jgi:hypothetical protein
MIHAMEVYYLLIATTNVPSSARIHCTVPQQQKSRVCAGGIMRAGSKILQSDARLVRYSGLVDNCCPS